MKKFIVLIALLATGWASAQINITAVEGLGFDTHTTAELNALTTKVLGDIYLNSDLGYHVWWDGDSFEAVSASAGGDLSQSEIDTFLELDAIVADASLAKHGDNISEFVNDSGYLTTETDDQTAAEVSVNAAGFDGNLTTDDDTVQEVAQKFDDFVGGGGGSGDVTAASSFANDNRVIRSDGTAKGVQTSGITVDDSNNMSGIGNITLSGTVDGRDVATDGTKLDGIEAGATGDQVAADVENSAAGNISATNVQAAINELDTEKVNLAGSTQTVSANTNFTGAVQLPSQVYVQKDLTNTWSEIRFDIGAASNFLRATGSDLVYDNVSLYDGLLYQDITLTSLTRTIDLEGSSAIFQIGGGGAYQGIKYTMAAAEGDFRTEIGHTSAGLEYTFNEGFTFLSPFSVYTASSTPAITRAGSMWLDNTVNPSVLKIYQDGGWTPVDASGSGLSANNQNRILNARSFFYVTKTTDFEFSADDVEVQSGTDIGKKVIVDVETGALNGELQNADLEVGESLIIEPNGGEINVFFAEGDTGEFINLTAPNNAITVDTGDGAAIIKKAENEFRVRGEYTPYQNIFDAWTAANPIGDFNPGSIDATAVSEGDPINSWLNAGSAGSSVTASGTERPLLHLNASSVRQARFDGADLLTAVSTTTFEFDPQVDEMTLVIKLGEDVTEGSFKYIAAKAGSTSATRTFASFIDSGGYKFYAGGDLSPAAGSSAAAEGDLIIATFEASATGLDVYVNGTLVMSNEAIGTGQNTAAPFTIGGREANASFTGDIERIAIYDRILTPTEIGNIEAQEGY